VIFRQAGIRIEWLNCLPGAGRQQKGVNCTQSPGVSPVGLRILPRLTATPGFIPEGALGVAVGNLCRSPKLRRSLNLTHVTCYAALCILDL
jgi:hypothetical protein